MGNRVTITRLQQMKQEHKKIVALTAYDYPTALIMQEVGIDMILIGDSLGQVVLGYESTLPVTVEEVLYHTKAVARGNSTSLLVADMPFLSYQVSIEEAVYNAGRFLKEGGAQAVKLEGGIERLSTISAILDAGIPVLGHIGFTPQSIHQLGGYKIIGKEAEKAKKLVEDAVALEEVGCFGIVLECVPYQVAKVITEKVKIPTIGIGSGIFCDGQILVLHDLIGFVFGKLPKHAKQYLNFTDILKSVLQQYQTEVREGKFPTETHSFTMDETEYSLFLQLISKEQEET